MSDMTQPTNDGLCPAPKPSLFEEDFSLECDSLPEDDVPRIAVVCRPQPTDWRRILITQLFKAIWNTSRSPVFSLCVLGVLPLAMFCLYKESQIVALNAEHVQHLSEQSRVKEEELGKLAAQYQRAMKEAAEQHKAELQKLRAAAEKELAFLTFKVQASEKQVQFLTVKAYAHEREMNLLTQKTRTVETELTKVAGIFEQLGTELSKQKECRQAMEDLSRTTTKEIVQACMDARTEWAKLRKTGEELIMEVLKSRNLLRPR